MRSASMVCGNFLWLNRTLDYTLRVSTDRFRARAGFQWATTLHHSGLRVEASVQASAA